MVTEQALSPLSCLPGPWLLLLWTVKSKKNFTMMMTGTSVFGHLVILPLSILALAKGQTKNLHSEFHW